MTMTAAFTGTRRGMTLAQRAMLALALRGLCVAELHVGDCVGADEEATRIAHALHIPTICHPPDKDALRAFTTGHVLVHPARDYLARDRDMVDAAIVVLAAPHGPEPPPPARGSGTWYTVRYARHTRTRCMVIRPDCNLWGGLAT